MTTNRAEIIKKLVSRSIEISSKSHNEIEKYCWMAVHEHRHGVMPSEYDIRDIDEDLYLLVLEKARSQLGM